MLPTSARVLVLALTLGLFPARVMAQAITTADGMAGFDVATARAVFGRVTNAKGEPVRGAMVEVMANGGANLSQVLHTDPDGVFRYQYNFIQSSSKEFSVTVTVSKKGYPKSHGYANYGASGKPIGILVILRSPPDDPTMLSESAMVSALTPGLRTLGAANGLSAKYLKIYAKAAGQFVDKNRLDLAVPSLQDVAAANPLCVRCRTMAALAEIHWGDWADAERNLVEAVNTEVKNPQLRVVEPLLAYGVWLEWEHQPDHAESYLAQAARDSPRDALVLQELGRVQCEAMNWEGANETLALALAAGAGPEARLMHAQALVWAGTVRDAEAEMNRYLGGRDAKKMPPYVREVWQKIQDRKQDSAALVKLQRHAAPYLDYLGSPPPGLQNVQPVGKDVKLAALLSAVGENVEDVYQKFPNTSSLEIIHQEKLDRKGKSVGALDQKFRYLCLMPTGEWGPQTNEFRADSTGHPAIPKGVAEDFMLTTGFVAAPLIFHPLYQAGTNFRLLGRQKVQGRDAFVIAFAQNPARSRMYGSFREGDTSRRTFYQGAAWIDAGNYQILRLRTDLLTPLPVMKLQMETTNIDFAEVHFNRLAQAFWLPSKVTVNLDWQGRRLRNRHEYSDFIVFNVDSLQKIAKPKGAPQDSADNAAFAPAAP